MNAGRKEVRKGNIKVKGEIRKQGRKKGDVNKALNGDTGKPEDDQLEEEEEVWSPRGAAVGRWRPLLDLPEVLQQERERGRLVFHVK